MVPRFLAIAFGSTLLLCSLVVHLGVAQDGPSTARGFDHLTASFYDAPHLNDFAFSRSWSDPIDFFFQCWGEVAPYEGCKLHPDLADGFDYSVSWEGELIVPATGDYTFVGIPDDGVRITLDGEEILDQGWRYPIPDVRPSPQTVFLNAGSHHVVIDYEQRVAFIAALQLRWSGPGFAEEVIPNLLTPPAVTRLIQYGFDADAIDEDYVPNLLVGSVDWMRGGISGDPELMPGASGGPEDFALLFNVSSGPEVDYLEVIRGDYLTFSQGILFFSKIYLEAEPTKPAMIIASQVDETKVVATSPWRISLDRSVVPGTLTFTLLLTSEDGSFPNVYYELADPTDYLGRWIDVGASYDAKTGIAALLWDGSWVATKDLGAGILGSRRGPVRIGKAFAAGTWAFEGGIDEVEIWGDRPACHRLVTATELERKDGEIDPFVGGIVVRSPKESELSMFCAGDAIYTVGEKVSLVAEASGLNAFYQWKGPLEYVEGSERHKYDISLTLLEDTTATAHFLAWRHYPRLARFPIDRQHNTGIDGTCNGRDPCAYGCELEAKALSNSDCHFGALDIFAPMDPKDGADPWPDDNQAYVVSASTGQVDFYCDFDAGTQELVGGNSAVVYVPNARDPEYVLYYAHMDQVCSDRGRNLCTRDLLARDCPGCEPHEPQTDKLQCPQIFDDLDVVFPGRRLGAVGRSGTAIGTTPHLHFTIFEVVSPGWWRADCETLNPLAFLYPLEERTRCRSSR